MGAKREFFVEYRTTWEEFARRISELQNCGAVGEADRARIGVALLEAEKARLAYNAARDRLAAQIAGLHPSAASAAQAVSQDRKVRATARLLWEFAGKPEGTAVADWLQAECVVRCASATVAR
jgi:hypothetical protein